MMVNACVTGILPGFRYVLLTDALIESLDARWRRRRFSDTRSAMSPTAISCTSPSFSWEAWGSFRCSPELVSSLAPADRALGLAHPVESVDS